MKKYIALVSSLLIFASVYAQLERMPFGDKMSYNAYKLPVIESKGAGTPSSAIFSDDFEGTGYQLTDKWEVLRSTTLDFQQAIAATNPTWFRCTAQSFNGNGSTYIKHGEASVAISFTAPDFTWLVTHDTIAIPSEPEASLKFWLWYYSNYTQNYITHFYVMAYDVDGRSLDTLLYYGKDQATSLPNQYKSLINLSLSKVGGKNVRLAFVYENRNNQNMGTQLAIDDIMVTNINIPDIELKAIPYKYSKVPKITFDSLLIDLKANIYNQGTVLNDTLKVVATCEKISSLQSVAEITDTLESGEQRVLTLAPAVKINATAESYTFNINSTTPPDTLDQNNTDNTTLEITNSIFATDRGVKGGISFSQITLIGNLYEFQRSSFIDGVEIGWAQNTSIPETEYPLDFSVYVLEINPANPQVSKTVALENFQKDYSANGGSIIYFFTQPVYCREGFSYYVLLEQSNDTPLGIGYDGNPYGAFWKIDGMYPLEATYMANQSIGNLAIRALVSEPVENPTVFFNIKNEQKEPAQNVKVQIIELDSTITTNTQGQASIKLNNGQYTYRIDSIGYSSFEKKFSVFSQNLVISDSLVKAYKVKFKVIDTNLAPLPNAKINVYPLTLTTNENGEDSTMLPSGNYSLKVLLSGYKMQTEVNLEVEEKDTIYTIVMEQATTYNLTVNVKTSKNEILPNAEVSIMEYGTLKTNSEGSCTFSGLLAGNIMGFVYSYNYIWGSIFMNLSSDSTINVILEPERYTATFFVSSKGVPIINAEIIIEGLDTLHTGLNGYAQSNYIPFGNGIPYTVKIKDYYTYSGTFDIWNTDVLVKVNLTPLGIDSEFDKIRPAIYPNPSSDFIIISGIDNYSISIFDLNGRMVYQNIPSENKVDISSLPKGIYIVKLATSKGFSIHKVLKQ
ncbi:MAG: T9SS type A sorting domain-containing protein [Bacteroidota bacterium]